MAAETELNVRVKGKDELSPTLAQLESRVIRWVGAISASIAAIKITTAPLVATAEFERELANVRKTTNFTTSEIRQLSDELQRLGTMTDVSTLDLTKIAAAAGQQGLGRFGVAGVVQFTESVSRMSSVLDITAEDAATNIGKIANVFKIPLQDIEQAVSTFNQVANNSTAEGEELLDVVRRIGDAAGALDLQQSVALAATGLDFGVSPEVVGTSFNKIFSSFRQRADEFGALLKVNTGDWIKMIEKDGVGALKMVLEAMRKLNPQAQQTAIVKMLGGGRIGALINKLIQDTQNSVLERNFAQALEGKKGTSAIQEQETVLNTLVAQSRAALSSLFALATDVTDGALQPLTEYVAQLNTALKSDGLRSFLTQVVSAVLELTGALVNAVKFVADLNVNWENFIRVAQVFIGLKLAQFFGSALTSSAGSFADKLKLIATGTENAAKGTKALATANAAANASQATADAVFKGSVASRLLGYEQLSKQMAIHAAAKKAEAAAEAEVARAAAAAEVAQRASVVAGGSNRAATSQASAAASAATAQRAALAAAEQRAAAAQAAVQQRLNASLAQKAQQDANTRLQIETAYQQRLAAIKATGTTVGLTALKREHANQIAQADAFHAKSIANTRAYWARQAAEAAAGSAVLVNLERQRLMNSLSAMDGALANQAVKGANATVATGAAAAANATLAATQTRLTAATAAANAASIAMQGFGFVMRNLGTILATVGRLIAGSFFWITILYTIADLTGLLGLFGDGFQRLTDKIGLTSEANRRSAVEDEKKKKRIEEQRQALQDLIDKYQEYVNASTGQVDQREVSRLTTIASTSEDETTRQQALAQLDELYRSLEARRDQLAQNLSKTNPEAIAAARRDIAAYTAEIQKLIREQEIPQLNYAANGIDYTTMPDNTKRIEELQKKIESAQKAIDTFGTNSDVARKQLDGLTASVAAVGANFASMFTPESLRYAQDVVPVFNAQREEAKRLEAVFKDLNQAARGGQESVKAAAAEAQAAWETQRAKVAETEAAITKYIKEQIAVKGLQPEVLNSWEQLLILIRNSGTAATVVAAAAEQVAAGAKADGKLANPNAKTPTSGTENAPPKGTGGESKARKEERARLALARAELQKDAARREEINRQALEREQDLYERGLVQTKAYFNERHRIEQAANANEITLKENELAEVETSIKRAKSKAEKDTFRATAVRLQSDIDVLNLKKASIDMNNREEERRATESFNDRLREETNKLVEQGLISADAKGVFAGNLDELLANYRLFIQQLRTAGKGGVADALIEGLNIEALARTLQPIQTDMEASFAAFSRYQARLQLAQEQGILTTNQYQGAFNAGIKTQIAELQRFINQQEEVLRQNASLAGTKGYAQIAAQVDAARLSLEQFRAQQNQIAIDFNKQNTSVLQNVLSQFRLTTEGIRDAFMNLIGGIVQNIQTALGNSIAEQIMQNIGQAGTGGLGGWLQNLVMGPESAAAGGLAERGATFANPLYVQDVNKVPGVAEGADALGDFMSEKGIVEKGVDKGAEVLAGPAAEGFFGRFSETLGTTFGSLSSGLSSMFGGLLSTLGSLFSGLIAAMSGGGSGGWLSAIGAAFGAAHTGGIAGQPKMYRYAPIAAFNNAVRYHNGGVAGLEPNEVPTILEEGETIRTKQQESALQAQLNAVKSSASPTGAGVRVVLVDDRTKIPEAMNSAEGDQVFVQQARRNVATLRQLMK